MLHQYEYVPKYQRKEQPKKKKPKGKVESKVEKEDPTEPKKPYIKVDLNDYFSKDLEVNTKRKFLKFRSYQMKSQQFFVILDNLDNFTVLDRDLSFRHLIKTHIEKTDEPQITSFDR